MKTTAKRSVADIVVDGFFLIMLNITLMAVTGFLTLDSGANLNSRAGAVLLSFLLPYFIVSKTPDMPGIERMLKFGGGFFVYLAISCIMVGLPHSFVTGLIPCLILSLAVLYYGKALRS